MTSLNSNFSPAVNSYLDEFPNYTTNDSNSSSNHKPLQEKEQLANAVLIQTSTTTIQSQGISTNCNTKKDEIKCNPASSSSLASAIESRNPCSEISPKKREYVIIICNAKDKSNVNDSDFNELLKMFFDRFLQSDSDIPASSLEFNENSAIVLFEGKVWISCDDELSFQWVSKNIKQFAPAYRAERLRDYLQLEKCMVIVPGICKLKKFEEIFDLLEKQNCGVSTKNWVIQELRTITDENDEYFDKAISNIAFNHVLLMFIDRESKELLEKTNYKLKYCFWEIVFKMKDFNKEDLKK